MLRSLPVRAIAIALLLAIPQVARSEVIDRVLAVVEGQIITLSDARAALTLRLVPEDVSVDPVNAALQRLIDRRLMLAEVDRYAPPEPPADAVDAALSRIQARFADPLAFETALNSTVLSREELRRFVRDSLRIETYVQQRFAAAVQPAEDDILRYYREHPEEFTVGGRLRPFDEVREAAQAGAAGAERERLITQWLEGLRRRASISVLYLPATR